MKKVLFILKDRLYNPSKTSYGLINSANHIANYLDKHGFQCNVVSVLDSNFIDKEVNDFRPDIVVIEALWVTADKFRELFKYERYKNILWIVRVHSNMGYLSTESIGLKLLNDYIELEDRLIISLNNKSFNESLSKVMNFNFTYLPNIITPIKKTHDYSLERYTMDIGCFGAIRLLKNQCFQAICAILAADKLGKKLNFHITSNPLSVDDPVIANLKQLFIRNKHELIIHEWMTNDDFLSLVKKMDIGLQLSYTESFNIITADFVYNNKLILVGEAIEWMPSSLKVSTINYEEVINKIVYLYRKRNNILLKFFARKALSHYNIKAMNQWKKFLRHYNYIK